MEPFTKVWPQNILIRPTQDAILTVNGSMKRKSIFSTNQVIIYNLRAGSSQKKKRLLLSHFILKMSIKCKCVFFFFKDAFLKKLAGALKSQILHTFVLDQAM